MKGLLVALGVIIVFAFIIFGMGGGCYNRMNSSRVEVDQKWGDVQNTYQRRSDLIPNLVEVVKGAANFEKSTLTDVIQARASATSIKIDPKDLTPEKMQQFQASQGQLSQALGRLMVVSEKYPELKATEQFTTLQSQIEGTENRIKVARDNYNASVKDYNIQVTSFPDNILAGMFGFKERPMFQADQAAQSAPKVNFGK